MACCAIAAATVALAGHVTPSLAGTPYVDGISDPHFAQWGNSSFGQLFAEMWFGSPHLTMARLIVQWNAMTERDAQTGTLLWRERFEQWLRTVKRTGLVPDIAVTAETYNGGRTYPDAAAYTRELARLLAWARGVDPIAYVEPWNEPNAQGNEPPRTAAGFANEAHSLCLAYGCTVIAGNFQDQPGMRTYEQEYAADLSWHPEKWGVHPYFAVNRLGGSEISKLVPSLPGGGSGDRIWITEISAYACYYRGQTRVEVPEERQALRARYLVQELMPSLDAAHVFYYQPVDESIPPTCAPNGSADNGLYVRDPGAYGGYTPRAATSFIFDGTQTPWALASAPPVVFAEATTMLTAILPSAG
jgi:hypothetical protein